MLTRLNEIGFIIRLYVIVKIYVNNEAYFKKCNIDVDLIVRERYLLIISQSNKNHYFF